MNRDESIANLRVNLEQSLADGPRRKFYQIALLVRERGWTWMENRAEIERLRAMSCADLDAEIAATA